MSSLEVSRPMMIVIVLMLIVSLPLGALYIHDRSVVNGGLSYPQIIVICQKGQGHVSPL